MFKAIRTQQMYYGISLFIIYPITTKIQYAVTDHKQKLVPTNYTNGDVAPQSILPNI